MVGLSSVLHVCEMRLCGVNPGFGQEGAWAVSGAALGNRFSQANGEEAQQE